MTESLVGRLPYLPGFESLADLGNLIQKKTKLVGWGTQGVVNQYFDKLPIKPSYFVDNDASRQGQSIHGKAIVPPEYLLTEERQDTVIAVFSSAYPTIANQAHAMGFDVFHAGHLANCNNAEYLAPLQQALQAAISLRSTTPPDNSIAIMIQGPFHPGITDWVIKVAATLNPRCHIIYSGWEDFQPSLFPDMERYVHSAILNPYPSIFGFHNRNLQIVSTLAGIRQAQEIGAKWILKVRSDTLLATSNVPAICLDALHSKSNDTAIRYGLKSRIVTTDIYTRALMPYHPSDMIMFGAVEDMEQYWNTPLDLRQINPYDINWRNRSVSDHARAGRPTETYLAVSFAERLGWPLSYSLDDSLDFYFDLFHILDQKRLGVYWAKNFAPDDSGANAYRRLLCQKDWEGLSAVKLQLSADPSDLPWHLYHQN